MALRDFFKKKKPKEKLSEQAEKPKEEIPLRKPAEVKPLKAKKEVKIGEAYPVRKAKISNGAYRALKSPHITEKATELAAKNQYAFKVWPRANKTEIKKSIQDVYGVDVLGVRIIKIPEKLRRLGRRRGWKSGYKKAIVRIKEGQKIEVLPR